MVFNSRICYNVTILEGEKMKKLGMLLVGIVGITLLSGCGSSSKKLTCSYDVEGTPNSKMEYTLTFDTKGEHLNSYILSVTASFDDKTSEEELKGEYEDTMKTCDAYKDMKGVTCDTKKQKNSITSELKVNLKELDDAEKEGLATFLLEDLTYENAKNLMESTEFKCK